MDYKKAILISLLLIGCNINTANACTGLGCTCSVSVPDMSYGNYDFLAGNNDISNNVEVTCSALVLGVLFNYTVEASAGQSNNFLNRQMASGAEMLAYNIYTDASRTQVWGDGTGGTSVMTDSYLLQILTPVVRNYFIYGRIPGSQIVSVGSYSDTITVTLTF